MLRICCIFYASRTRKGCHNDANLTRISPTTNFLYQNKLCQLNANLFFVPDKISKNKQFFSSSPHSQQTSLRLSEQIIERCFSLTTLLTNSVNSNCYFRFVILYKINTHNTCLCQISEVKQGWLRVRVQVLSVS